MGISSFIADLLPDDGGPSDGDGSDRGPSVEPASQTVIYECRECGTTVSADTRRCPTCDSTEIAEYPVE